MKLKTESLVAFESLSRAAAEALEAEGEALRVPTADLVQLLEGFQALVGALHELKAASRQALPTLHRTMSRTQGLFVKLEEALRGAEGAPRDVVQPISDATVELVEALSEMIIAVSGGVSVDGEN